MCDQFFPEVDSCCMLVSIRVGMILIGVLSISTGAITLGVMQQKRNIDFDTVSSIYEKANYSKPEQVFSDLSNIISMTCTAMSVAFMFAGIALLFSTLTDQEGFAQMFVILVFINVLIGTLALVAISFECMYLEDKCLLGSMDWLSGSITLLALLFYLIIWYYFCCVANSYALNAYA